MQVRNLGEVSGSWLLPGSFLAIVTVWEVNQWKKDFSLFFFSLFLFLSISVFLPLFLCVVLSNLKKKVFKER